MGKVIGLQSRLDLYPIYIIVGRHFWLLSSSFSHFLCTTHLAFFVFFFHLNHITQCKLLLCPFVDFGMITLCSHLSITITYLESHITCNGVCFSMWLNWLLFMTFFLIIELWYLLPNGLVVKLQKCIAPICTICYICLWWILSI